MILPKGIPFVFEVESGLQAETGLPAEVNLYNAFCSSRLQL